MLECETLLECSRFPTQANGAKTMKTCNCPEGKGTTPCDMYYKYNDCSVWLHHIPSDTVNPIHAYHNGKAIASYPSLSKARECARIAGWVVLNDADSD